MQIRTAATVTAVALVVASATATATAARAMQKPLSTTPTTRSGTAVAPAADAKGDIRIAGRDRYETAVKAARSFVRTGDTITVASGTSFPDALVASNLAASAHGAVLLTPGTTLRADVAAEIRRVRPMSVVVVGGRAAVSDGVLAAIRAAAPKAHVVRVDGRDRYAVAANAAMTGYAPYTHGAVIVSRRSTADAISAATLAGSGFPVLFADGALTADTRKALTKLRRQAEPNFRGAATVFVSSTGAVPARTAAAVKEVVGPKADIVRFEGATPYATSAKIAHMFWPEKDSGDQADHVAYVDAASWPDAVVAGPSRYGSRPVMFTKATCMPAPTKAWDAVNPQLRSRTWIGSAHMARTAC